VTSLVTAAARSLADTHGRPVRTLLSREDAVRLGPKRPPVAGGIRPDGTGVLRMADTPGSEAAVAAIAAVAPGLVVEPVPVPGPPTSWDLRAAGWAEAAALLAAVTPAGDGEATVRSPEGASARARVRFGDEPSIDLRVTGCGPPLDEIVLRSYCVGAAHMGLGWVCSEGVAVDEAGEVHDLTIRSFGILRAVDMPQVTVEIVPSEGPPVNGSDAVFAAVAAAAWRAQGCPPEWPTGLVPRNRR
jgi:hypothetical protein